MAGLLIAIGIVVALLFVCLVVGAGWLWWMGYLPPIGAESARLSPEAREAEEQIADIGRRAQEAIMTEALSRLRSRYGDHA